MATAETRVSWLREETPVWSRTLTAQSRTSTDPRLSTCPGWNQRLTGSRKETDRTGVLETGILETGILVTTNLLCDLEQDSFY